MDMNAGGILARYQPVGQTPALRPGAPCSDSRSAIGQRVALVQQFALFSGVPAADCATILAAAQEKHFSRRQTIFFEGDTIRQIWLLISGYVKVTQFSPSGSEVILRLNGPGEVIGPLGLCSRGNHCSTAQTLQASKALVWDATFFEGVSERFPLLGHNIARILGERLREMEARFREISTQKVAARLGSELVRLVSHVGQRVNGAVEISLSREELAQLTGTTLFTVSRLLCQWEQRGIVKTRREAVLVCDAEALGGLSEGE